MDPHIGEPPVKNRVMMVTQPRVIAMLRERPPQLLELPHYTYLPDAQVGVRLDCLPQLLNMDIDFELRGALPITGPISELSPKGLLGDTSDPSPPVPDPTGPEPPLAGTSAGTGTGGQGSGGGGGTGAGDSGAGGHGFRGDNGATGSTGGKSGPGAKGFAGGGRARPFISNVGTHPDDEEPDPDGLAQEARMALEEKAIVFILAHEPNLRRTAKQNPGFDLFEADANDQPTKWVEVKAMTGDLHGRPVGVSRTQFDCARDHREGFWLYVVEHAGDPAKARLTRIRDPFGKARTFTFDHGWLSVAEDTRR